MSQNSKPNNAFILAAGKGTRLRPHTNDKPKPMVEVHGQPIITHIIDKLSAEKVSNITVNTSYLGKVLEDYLTHHQTPSLYFSHENELLDTGGGVKNALHTMKNQPFYLINGDAYWVDDSKENSALSQLYNVWDDSQMDILLLLQPQEIMTLTKGVGDYDMDGNGALTRTKDLSGEYMFTGIRIVHPRIFEQTPDAAFSFLECMDKAQENGRLHGVHYQEGIWHHISTPDDLNAVNNDGNQKQKVA